MSAATPLDKAHVSSRGLSEPDVALRCVTMIAGVVIALTFMFGFGSDVRRLGTAMLEAANSQEDTGTVDLSHVRTLCVDIGQMTQDARAYFRIPEPQAQSLWEEFLTHATKGSQDCEQAVDQQNDALITSTGTELTEGASILASILDRLTTVLQGGHP